MKISFLWCIYIVALVVTNAAELKWDKTEYTLEPDDSATVVSFSFPFVAEGSGAVEVLSVSPSCGCTIAKINKSSYNAGERGAITGSFSIGSRRGVAKVGIRVTTRSTDGTVSKSEDKPVHLKLNVKISEPVIVNKTIFLWRKNSVLEVKTAIFTSTHNIEKVIIENESELKEFGVELVDLGEKTFKINIAPLALDSVRQEKASVNIVLSGGRVYVIPLNMIVR